MRQRGGGGGGGGGGDGGGAPGGRSKGLGLKIALACLMISMTMNILFVLKLGEKRGGEQNPSHFKRMRILAAQGGGAAGGGGGDGFDAKSVASDSAEGTGGSNSNSSSSSGSNNITGLEFGGTVEEETLAPATSSGISPDNPLHHWATAHVHGPILWKWNEYFDIYHRSFSRLRNKSPIVLLMGVNTGGDLFLFRWYFGPGVKIYGVDINPECKLFEEEDDIEIFIGDQGDEAFLESVIKSIGKPIDVVLDDASHTSWLTLKSLAKLWPAVKPATGIFVIEDTHNQPELLEVLGGVACGQTNPRKARQQCSKLPDLCTESHEVLFSYGMVVIQKNGRGLESQAMYGDERLPFEWKGRTPTKPRNGAQQFRTGYDKVYKGKANKA